MHRSDFFAVAVLSDNLHHCRSLLELQGPPPRRFTGFLAALKPVHPNKVGILDMFHSDALDVMSLCLEGISFSTCILQPLYEVTDGIAGSMRAYWIDQFGIWALCIARNPTKHLPWTPKGQVSIGGLAKGAALVLREAMD